MPMRSVFKNASQFAERLFVDGENYSWQVISGHLSSDDQATLPIELGYALALSPARQLTLKKLLDSGCGIAFRTCKRTPPNVLASVRKISSRQAGLLFPWLENFLILKNHSSTIPNLNLSNGDEQDDLSEALENLKNFHDTCAFCQITHSSQSIISEQDTAWLNALNRDIHLLHASRLPRRISADLFLPPWRKTLVVFLAALIIIAPLVNLFESLSSGLGIVFAAFIPGASLFVYFAYSIYADGLAWRQARKRYLHILLLLAASLFFSVSVPGLMDQFMYVFAGASFALAIAVLPAVKYAIRVSGIRRRVQLMNKSANSNSQKSFILLAMQGPVWWISPVSFTLPIITTAITFAVWPSVISNSLTLALLSVQPFLLIGLLAGVWNILEKWLFKRQIERFIGLNIITPIVAR